MKFHGSETEQELTLECVTEVDDTTSDIVRMVDKAPKSAEQKAAQDVFKVNRRIKQNISLEELEEAGEDDEDASYNPPKGIFRLL